MGDSCKNRSSDATRCSSTDVSSADVMLESPHGCACGHDKAEAVGAEGRKTSGVSHKFLMCSVGHWGYGESGEDVEGVRG